MKWFKAPPAPPKWKTKLLEEVAQPEGASMDWGTLQVRIKELALAQPKKWGEAKRKAWEAAWLEAAEKLRPRLRTGDDWVHWKACTVAWHKPMYESGVCEWEFSFPPDDKRTPLEKRIQDRNRSDTLRGNGTKEILKTIGSWGVSWQERERLDKAGIPLNTPTSKRSSLLVAEFKPEKAKDWSDQDVWQKVLFAEWDASQLPWQRFVSNTLNLKYPNLENNPPAPDLVSSAEFWLKEVLNLPIQRHKNGGGYGHEPSWCADPVDALWPIVHKNHDYWGFYKAWADRHAHEEWPENVVVNFWGNAFYKTDSKRGLDRESAVKEHRDWLLKHHFENATYVPLKELLHGRAHFNRWRRERAEEWAEWMESAQRPIDVEDFDHVWYGLGNANKDQRKWLFGLGERATKFGFLDIQTQAEKQKNGFHSSFWMSGALEDTNVRAWVSEQIEKAPRLAKEWVSYFQDQERRVLAGGGDGSAKDVWLKQNMPAWERSALVSQYAQPTAKKTPNAAL